jgi:AcrR family transcriptional regulator
VANEAGYSKGAVYSNFESKDDLFLAVLEQRVDLQVKRIAAEVDTDVPLEVQAGQAAEAWLNVFRESQWRLLLMEFATHAARRPDLQARFRDRNRQLRSEVPSLIEHHLDSLGLRSPLPAEDLATVFYALGSGFLLEKLVDPDGIRDTLFGDALMLVLGGLRAAEPVGTPAAAPGAD